MGDPGFFMDQQGLCHKVSFPSKGESVGCTSLASEQTSRSPCTQLPAASKPACAQHAWWFSHLQPNRCALAASAIVPAWPTLGDCYAVPLEGLRCLQPRRQLRNVPLRLLQKAALGSGCRRLLAGELAAAQCWLHQRRLHPLRCRWQSRPRRRQVKAAVAAAACLQAGLCR